MALIVADRVQETTNSTGTGAYTLGGAVPGFQTFASEVSNADTVYYSITDNVDFEVGLGTYASSGGTITRTTVFTSSNSNSAVNWGVGTKNIFLTYPADKAVVEDASNNVTIGNNLVVGGTVDGRDVAADGTKLDFVTVTQAVNLDQMETDIAALENGMVYKGDWNAGSGSFPGSGSAQTGWFYYVSGAGTVNGISFTVGDNIVATTDNASTSTYASNWSKHDQTDAVQAVVGLTGSIAKGSLLSALNVEDGADVTDTANVTSAGALMDSEVTNLAQVKAFNSSDYATAAQGTTADNALPKAGGTMSGNIDGNGNKMLFANMYSNLVDLPSATTYHGMFAHVHATGKAYFAHSGAWVPLANESTTLALAGGTMTGDVLYNDNIKAKFGADSDLQIYHNGSNSYIKEGGTGNLNISTDGGELALLTQGGLEYGVRIIQDGAVEIRHDDITKIATTSTGVQVSGNISNATGDFTLDVAGDITFDADGGDWRFKDAGTTIATYSNVGGSWYITSNSQDGDIVFQGNDGGATISALTLDMSDAGTATFNSHLQMGDNKTLRLGSSNNDLKLYHDGTNSHIDNDTGDLNIDVAGDIILDSDGANWRFKDGGTEILHLSKPAGQVKFFSSVQDADMVFGGMDGSSAITALTLDMSDAGTASFNNDIKLADNGKTIFGSSSDLEIYHDGANSVINEQGTGSLRIRNNGVNQWEFGDSYLKGNDNKKIILGDSSDLQIYHDGSHSYILDQGVGYLHIKTSDRFAVQSATGETMIEADANGTAKLYYDNSKKFETTSSGVTVTGDIANSSGSMTIDVAASLRLDSGAGEIELKEAGTVFGNFAKTGNDFRINQSIQDGDLVFRGNDGGSIITALTLDMSNAGAATFNSGITVGGNINGGDCRGDIWLIGRDDNDYIAVNPTEINFVLDNAVDMRLDGNADLHVEGNVIAYSTTISDERLKKDIVKIDNALDKVSQLNGYTFEYLADGKKSAGVIAQEVEKVMPSAITESTLPLKMGDDNETQYMTVQYDQLMGLMVEAIKELKAEIEELKAR